MKSIFWAVRLFGADAPIVLIGMKDLNIISNFGNLKERPKERGWVPNPMLVILHPMATVLYTQ